MTTRFEARFKIGEHDGVAEYLAAPSWDCGWYWGFGYLQNKDTHHHVDTLDRDKNLYDALKGYYGDTLTITDDDKLWTFCELMASFYALKETAEVLGRGGAHYAHNPCASIIKNEKESNRINEKVMPIIFDTLEDVISDYR